MIFATINPAATVVKTTNNPFNSTTTTITGSVMTAIARPYKLGAEKTRFEVLYGTVIQNASGSVISFQKVTSQEITLTADQLSNWGSDDAVVLQAIANQVGTAITSIISGSSNSILIV